MIGNYILYLQQAVKHDMSAITKHRVKKTFFRLIVQVPVHISARLDRWCFGVHEIYLKVKMP